MLLLMRFISVKRKEHVHILLHVITYSFFPSSIPLQLHRLTWWTRHSKEPRIDFNDPWTTKPRTPPRTPDPTVGEEAAVEAGPCWKRTGMWLCGLSGPEKKKLTLEEKHALELKLTSIEEEPIWRNVCNANALILLSINIFMWGYFAWVNITLLLIIDILESHIVYWITDHTQNAN